MSQKHIIMVLLSQIRTDRILMHARNVFIVIVLALIIDEMLLINACTQKQNKMLKNVVNKNGCFHMHLK